MGDGGQARFGSVVTAMVTPFDDDGRLDLDAAGELARWLVNHGSEGLVVGGTTGEGSVLSDAERRELWRAVAEAVSVPVLAGAGTSDTAHSIALAKAAAQCEVDGLLVVTPYYSRPSQAGLFAHFQAVAEATDLPVMLYDIPSRTGRRVATETVLRLAAEVPQVVALKDAAGDVAATARLAAQTPRSFEIYSGDDALTLPLLSVGAVGVVSVASHWVGKELAAMVASFLGGDVEGARQTNASLLADFAFESSEAAPNPLPAKAVLRALGLAVGQCRPPMGPAPAELDRQAGEVARRLNLATPVGRPVA